MRYLLLSMIALVALNLTAYAVPDVDIETSKAEIVKPGEDHTNVDDVTVTNDKTSRGKAKIDPKKGAVEDETTVKTWTNFTGAIDGLDANDTVNLGGSNDVEISGEGGTVNVQGGSSVTVTNAAGGSSMTVNLPSGTTVTVPPGSTVTVTT